MRREGCWRKAQEEDEFETRRMFVPPLLFTLACPDRNSRIPPFPTDAVGLDKLSA